MFTDVPILTARPSEEEMAGVPHKLYGMLNMHEQPTAGKWLKLAKMEIDWALGEGLLPIVVGGTGLYLKALMQGIADIPDVDTAVRAQSASDFEAMGKEAFAERLRAVDPEFFTRLAVADKQRLIRGWEVWLGTGKPLTYWQQQKTEPFYRRDQFDLQKIDMPREELYARCDARFLAMIEVGAVEQVEAVLPELREDSPLWKVIGLRELAAYINGEKELDQSVKNAQQATRNYAKRQITWLKHQL